MRAKIEVFLKSGVLDPQGETIKRALHTLGYESIKDVRQGKVFYIEIEDDNPEKTIEEIARKVLANPVIEDFKWEIEK
ncbi:MAG: phosphoribosylformylglycinamidine synthase subunit PurS [Candidatus Aminicenantes bacterium]|nr:phosphoribosylformylglycinamidine synthase subunit PurS [Candidatus Aminicenantes bacterium]